MLKGLPASGKSTHAKELVAKGWKRVNKDDLRAMIDCGTWSKNNEKFILRVEQNIVREYLVDHDVVVDDTNFAHEESWRDIADECFADFEVKFFDTPVMECIERDLKRGDKSVGVKVIMGMYNKFIKPKESFSTMSSRMPAYIFDIDGTIAHMSNRSPYDWSKVDTDSPDLALKEIVSSLDKTVAHIIYLSGRDGSCKEKTQEWLIANNFPSGYLIMRDAGDQRKDSIVKKEIYQKHIEPFYNVIAVFDDRNQVVDMWRSLGLKCCQVDYGFF